MTIYSLLEGLSIPEFEQGIKGQFNHPRQRDNVIDQGMILYCNDDGTRLFCLVLVKLVPGFQTCSSHSLFLGLGKRFCQSFIYCTSPYLLQLM